ncbi:3-oxoacyl-reductase [Diplogelasinospora grovesii]|uniref:3-oxoacyl-reductase n=1 Tax=Diplogelasinospora grovesii TaxID=303347 RepID=A0AAN6NG91_9PEZI|nr:3-oxoacyl-reductase [Diplogelasinospora grovesii]
MAPRVWLVTGTTSGIGLSLITYIVSRGDKVIASGRNVESNLAHLKSDSLALLELDISSDRDVIAQKVKEAWEVFGHIDILFNNAGMSAMKSAEEADDDYITKMFTANLFGHMTLTSLLLPLLRSSSAQQHHGSTIGFTSSSAGYVPLPFMSHYAASKAALSTYVESLHREVSPLGINCVAFECGGFPTHLGQPRHPSASVFGTEGTSIPEAYGPGLGRLAGMFAADPMAYMPGDLVRIPSVIYDIMTRTGVAEHKPWGVRVLLGSDAYDSVKQKCEEMLTVMEEWKDVSKSTDREGFGGTKEEYLKFVSILD